jgi:hypothetical protein
MSSYLHTSRRREASGFGGYTITSICSHPVLVTEGCLQHLKTWGGERWPRNDCASEMRRADPAVEAAAVPARQPRATGPRDGGAGGRSQACRFRSEPTAVDRRSQSKGIPEKVGPPRRCVIDLQTPHVGRIGTWRTCGNTGLDKPRYREVSRPAGPFGVLGVRRAGSRLIIEPVSREHATSPFSFSPHGRRWIARRESERDSDEGATLDPSPALSHEGRGQERTRRRLQLKPPSLLAPATIATRSRDGRAQPSSLGSITICRSGGFP